MTAILTGAVLVLVYEMLRWIRTLIPHRHWVVQAEDLIFWIAAAIFVFVQMFRTNYGSVRWYFVCGGAAGAVLTGKIIGFFQKKLKKLSKHLKKDIKETNIDNS